MADLDLDRLEALAVMLALPERDLLMAVLTEMRERRRAPSHIDLIGQLLVAVGEGDHARPESPQEVWAGALELVRQAVDAMNVCARCGEAIDEEAMFDRRWPEGWERCTSPVHEGRTFVHSVRYHRRQAEEARSSASSIRHSPDPYAEAQRLRQGPVVDLMAALEDSLAAAKAAQAARAKKQAEEADAATPTPSTDNAH